MYNGTQSFKKVFKVTDTLNLISHCFTSVAEERHKNLIAVQERPQAAQIKLVCGLLAIVCPPLTYMMSRCAWPQPYSSDDFMLSRYILQ